MDKKNKRIILLFVRYGALVLLGIYISFIYKILLPLTLWPVYFLLGLVYDVSVFGNSLLLAGGRIELINACIAGSAYYFLLILNLTTPIKARQRFFSITFSLLALLVLNILRIFLLSALYVSKFEFFDIAHKIFWYALSILFVVGIWFLTVHLFKIKNIPVYSDLVFLLNKKS
jgi:exosortase/archaeosortase family protein